MQFLCVVPALHTATTSYLALFDQEHPSFKKKAESYVGVDVTIYYLPRETTPMFFMEVLDEQEILKMLPGSPDTLLSFVDSSSSSTTRLRSSKSAC